MPTHTWTTPPPPGLPYQEEIGTSGVRPGAARVVPPTPRRPAQGVAVPAKKVQRGKISSWPFGVLLAVVIFFGGMALWNGGPSRNVQVPVYTQVLRDAGLTVQDVCGYAGGGPVISAIEVADYGTMQIYQLECKDGSTRTVDVQR